jgi:hypothetical protein
VSLAASVGTGNLLNPSSVDVGRWPSRLGLALYGAAPNISVTQLQIFLKHSGICGTARVIQLRYRTWRLVAPLKEGLVLSYGHACLIAPHPRAINKLLPLQAGKVPMPRKAQPLVLIATKASRLYINYLVTQKCHRFLAAVGSRSLYPPRNLFRHASDRNLSAPANALA